MITVSQEVTAVPLKTVLDPAHTFRSTDMAAEPEEMTLTPDEKGRDELWGKINSGRDKK